jgi:hypothetical protein
VIAAVSVSDDCFARPRHLRICSRPRGGSRVAAGDDPGVALRGSGDGDPRAHRAHARHQHGAGGAACAYAKLARFPVSLDGPKGSPFGTRRLRATALYRCLLAARTYVSSTPKACLTRAWPSSNQCYTAWISSTKRTTSASTEVAPFVRHPTHDGGGTFRDITLCPGRLLLLGLRWSTSRVCRK